MEKTYGEIMTEVGKMEFTWDEVMKILDDVGKDVVMGSTTSRTVGLISKHFQHGHLICTFNSDVFWDLKHCSEETIEKYKKHLYQFEGMYSSWNNKHFYTYIKENNIR